jgi:hypothetical protein
MYTLTRRPWGWLIIGIALVIGGLIWGLTSHGVSYQNSSQSGTFSWAIGESTGNVYIHPDGSANYFVAFSGSFNQSITEDDMNNSAELSYVAQTTTSTLDPAFDDHGTTVNDAYKIEKLVLYDKDGNVQETFTTSEYRANPTGFYDNEWLKAIWLVLAGLVVTILSIIFMARGRGAVAKNSFSINAAGAMPYQPGMQAPNPYGQPQAPATPYGVPPAPYTPPVPPSNPYEQAYQGPGQYPAQAPTYPPQPPYPPQQ